MRSTYPHHRLFGGRTADHRDCPMDSSMRGDNVAAWEERCAPLVEHMSGRVMTLAEVREWGNRYRVGNDRFGKNLAEDCLYWLEARGRVVRGDDRKWRLT